MFDQIRSEIRRVHKVLTHGASTAEKYVHGELGQLHDNILRIEAAIVPVELKTLVELRDFVKHFKGKTEIIDALIGQTEAFAKEYAANQAAANPVPPAPPAAAPAAVEVPTVEVTPEALAAAVAEGTPAPAPTS